MFITQGKSDSRRFSVKVVAFSNTQKTNGNPFCNMLFINLKKIPHQTFTESFELIYSALPVELT